ncbi:hypothetical protein [Methylorubrum populi]|uniref:Uncharacterized protein n=1 Tax=Methylorubrum populi TaxID=223967 RepID=A0A833J6B3_9HYPH|nr:hypothetical protein [Methylorubrum populi]KAB7785423.1 hypothetical protein F8B43_1924 [Methylorubrum populi]
MLAGGTTDVSDIIAHFIGHLRLNDGVPRVRDGYEDPAHPAKLHPWLPRPPAEPDPDRPLDELPSRPFRADLAPGGEAFSRMPNFPGHRPPLPTQDDPLSPGPLSGGRLPPAGGGGGGGGRPHGETLLDTDPDQQLLQVRQVNRMVDDDVLLMRTDVDLASFHDVDIDATIAALSRIAQSRLPADLTLHNPTTAEAVELVMRRDGARSPDQAEEGGRDAAPDHPMGTYLDGVLQPPEAPLRFTLPKAPSVVPEAHDGLTDPGLEARTGGNVTVNTATILDDHGHATALAVKGNAYTTDAILQVNVLMSRAEVSVAGESLMRSIVTDGNEAHNTARIADHDTSGLVKHLTFGSLAQIDRIDGDFYGVNVLRQVNLLSDNDITVQGNFGAYYAVHAGENLESNSFRLSEIGARYDLIVVDGNYHSTNLIHQTNVLLNDDVIWAYTARGDNVSQSISTGDNVLENKAAIDRYGSEGFRPLNATLGNALDGLQDGVLPPELAATFPSHGKALNILHVTGDFYDINVIQQTNLVSDVDGIVQHAASAGPSVTPSGEPTASTQTAESGGNHLVNLAGIANVGTTSDLQFVGGHHYDTAILLQANFVTQSTQVTVGDTHNLVPEIVAFTGLAESVPIELPGPSTVTADSHMQQDLFHGMLS